MLSHNATHTIGEDMRTKRSTVTPLATKTVLAIAAAAAATLAAMIFLLHPPVTHAAEANGPAVSTATTGLGRILVDSNGKTLYLFQKDRNGKSACLGKCASFWPPLIASSKPRATGGVKASLIGTTKRADGRMQVTYNHHPLYMFVKDTRKGQTNGEGVNAFGANWYVLSPAGTKIDNDDSPSSSPGGLRIVAPADST
jgi:predicted lipoprotein with Yx(FWY)xxD motif